MMHTAVRNNREDEADLRSDRPEEQGAIGFEALQEEEEGPAVSNVEGGEDLLELERAATKLQALERGRRGRASVKELKQGRAGEDKGGAGAVGSNAANAAGELAATKLQALERGRRGRAGVKELKQGRAREDKGGAGAVGSNAANEAGDASSTAQAHGIEAGALNPCFLGSRCSLLFHI
jgi:hypothetical protein